MNNIFNLHVIKNKDMKIKIKKEIGKLKIVSSKETQERKPNIHGKSSFAKISQQNFIEVAQDVC